MRVMRFLQSMCLSSFRALIIGATRSEGGRSQGKRDCFSEGFSARLFVLFQKGQPTIWRETETR